MIASSSNGRTADSDSVNLGSSPGEAANKNSTREVLFLLACLSEVKNQVVRNRVMSRMPNGVVAKW